MTDKMPENWKTVVEFDGKYLVSDIGNVFSKKLNRNLKANPDWGGYLQVSISHNGKTYTRKVHKLMADAFLERTSHTQINHKDGDRKNNILSNFEEVSNRENVSHGRSCKEFVGATYLKRVNKWQSRIEIGGKRIFLGVFDAPELASDAYKAALKHYGLENKYAG